MPEAKKNGTTEKVRVQGMLVKRTSVCYKMKEQKVDIPNVGEKTVVVGHDRVPYVKDEKSGCFLRCGKNKPGKAAKKQQKRERIKARQEAA